MGGYPPSHRLTFLPLPSPILTAATWFGFPGNLWELTFDKPMASAGDWRRWEVHGGGGVGWHQPTIATVSAGKVQLSGPLLVGTESAVRYTYGLPAATGTDGSVLKTFPSHPMPF